MLNIKNITVKYIQENSEKVVLENFSCKILNSELVALMGENGSGKSTLFAAIGGEIELFNGSICINNKDFSSLPTYKRALFLSKVMQNINDATFGEMSIKENLAFAFLRGKRRMLRFWSSKKKLQLFKERLLMLEMGLENRLDELVKNLSGGQRQALALIMATISNCKVLLLDEHTAALDPAMADKIMQITKKLTIELGISVLMISHNQILVDRYCDRIIKLNNK
jgi:putative tryptophan/tyrosine transport system ATP-binding protein